MKNLLLIILFFLNGSLSAQLYDKNWVMGYPLEPNYPLAHPFIVSFEPNGIKFIPIISNMIHRFTNVSMSDAAGNLQFYTNGTFINNHQHQLMENGNDIIYPSYFLAADGIYLGVRAYNCTESVTEKNNYNIYQNHAEPLEDLPLDTLGIDSSIVCTKMFVTKVDMNANNGLGKVVYKRKLVYDDQNFYLNTFVRHANGRDWWSIINHVNGKDYTVLEWKNDSILSRKKYTFLDSSAQPDKNFSQGLAQKCFSRDGSLFIDLRATNEIRIFNYDRCSGILSYNSRIEFKDDPKWAVGQSYGVELSPNNRFLYLSRYDANSSGEDKNYAYVCQMDLQDPDPWKTKIILLDSFFDTEFVIKQKVVPWIFRYGIDGKLYFISNGFKTPLYVIQNPNEKGTAAGICDTCFNLPFLNHATLPDFPNYRLGPLKGSPCDTILGVANQELNSEKDNKYALKVSPNPATDRLVIEVTMKDYSQKDTELLLYDITGKEVLPNGRDVKLPEYTYISYMDVSKLPAGIYTLHLKVHGQTVAAEKVVVMR